jgi:hypothetical protein
MTNMVVTRTTLIVDTEEVVEVPDFCIIQGSTEISYYNQDLWFGGLVPFDDTPVTNQYALLGINAFNSDGVWIFVGIFRIGGVYAKAGYEITFLSTPRAFPLPPPPPP